MLANQIAAGEVVERPASVVKELVENSLDAGATQIDIDIERGGHKRICIRDNGKGIVKDELGLALSRHATSKISSLDDLEQIMSLGFRGEALASISSVSRLTLTSKPKAQLQAWQAYCEGRDMAVQLQPAAHPDGTSIDVLDLFYNTPARRRFLRTEKTEFTHIDELVKRIALSRFDVAITLRHNGKVVRKFPLADSKAAQSKRIMSVCGSGFQQNAISVDADYEGLQLSGWLAGPGGEREQNDLQYFYVNGRMMRDKLLNHAIRQAFEGLIHGESYPAYVLYLTLDPRQVDVNVHPAKHEVRFHQARTVHDFVYRVINSTLENAISAGLLVAEEADDSEAHVVVAEQATKQASQVREYEPAHNYIRPLRPAATHGTSGYARAVDVSQQPTAAAHYQTLMQTPDAPVQSAASQQIYWLPLPNEQMLVRIGSKFFQLSHNHIVAAFVEASLGSLIEKQQQPVSQPLLMPVALAAETNSDVQEQNLQAGLLPIGIDIALMNGRWLLRKVPAGLRELPWSQLLPDLIKINDGVNCYVHMLAKAVTQLPQPVSANIQQAGMRWLSTQTEEQGCFWLERWGRSIPLTRWLSENE